MKLTACLAIFSMYASSAAFAEEPQSPPSSQSAAQAEKPVTATAAAAAAAAVAPTPPTAGVDTKPEAAAAAAKAATDAEIKTMRSRGYKPVNRNGTLVYCRAEGQIGTHFQQERCSTMDQLKQAELSGKDYVKSIQQQGSPNEFKGDMPGGPTH
jgi:hypothetical protein